MRCVLRLRFAPVPMALALVFASGLLTLADRVVKLDGTAVEAEVTAIDADGNVQTAGDRRFVLQQLRSIERQVEVTALKGQTATVHLLGDGEIAAEGVTIRDGRVRVNRGKDEWELPLRFVRAIRFLNPGMDREGALKPFEDARRAGDLESDRMYAWAEEKLTPVRCVIQSLDGREIKVEYKGEERTVPRERLAGVVFASAADAPDRSGHVRATLTDGSILWGRAQRLEDGTLTLEPFSDVRLAVPWKTVQSLAVRSENVTYLSDMTPAEVEQNAIATFPWPYQRDRNVLKQPLRLGGNIHTRGLGVHAHNRLAFKLDKDYTRFAATVGIDDSAGKEGDCEFVVTGDGDVLFTKRMKAGTAPESFSVPLGGVRTLALEVVPGENLDLGDVANWCEARLLREPGSPAEE